MAPKHYNNRKAPSLVEEFDAIKTVEELNEKAPKLHKYFQTVSGLTRIFKFLDINTTGPKQKTGPNAQKKHLYDKNNKHEIQALYDRQQHRAVQEILIGPTVLCSLPQEKVEKCYVKVFGEVYKSNISDLPPHLWENPAVEEKDNNEIIRKFTSSEIRKKLQSKIHNPLANSRTVGLDKIKYTDLYYSDKDCLHLTSFFNACLRVNAVPDIWRKTYSVLIKNSAELKDEDIKNWHLVTMINSIPKLFQCLIAARLIVWAKKHQRLSPTQKGLLLYNASCETSFILQECQKYAEKNNHNLAVAWLDFSNASDSVPQNAVSEALIRHSVPLQMRNIIESSVRNVETKIRLMFSETGFTKDIKILKGLPQGCPINPILLDLVLEPLLRTLATDTNNVFKIYNQKINHFVIPNELVLIADSSTKLQDLLKLVENTARTIGLQFNANKCSTYHYDSKEKKIIDSSFLFFEQKLTTLSEEKIIDYFGVRQGLSIGQDGIPTVEEMIKSVESVSDSKLNIFQKSEAIQNYVMPRAENCLRGLQNFDKELIANMDKILQEKFKSWLSIPENAQAESIVFQCASLNETNNITSSYLPLLDLFYIMKIAHAFKMLISDDDTVKNIALDSLSAEVHELVQRKSKTQMSLEESIKYLSGGLHTKVTENNTIWKMVREATLNLKLKINFVWKYDTESKEIQIVIKNSKKSKTILGKHWSTDAARDLKVALINYYINKVKKNPENQKPGPKPGPKPKPKTGSKPGPKSGKNTSAPVKGKSKGALLKAPILQNPLNVQIGYPPLYTQQSFMPGLIY